TGGGRKRVRPGGLADEAAAEAHCYGMRPGARLELRQQMPDVRLDGFFRKEQLLADFAVYEPVGDQLEHLDLAARRLLLELAKRALKRDHVGPAGTTTPRRDFLETARMRQGTAEGLLALRSIHARNIGARSYPL